MTESLRVGQFLNKNHQIVVCQSGDSILKAKSIMLLNDYSQVPVLKEDKVYGCVSWKSIVKKEVIGNCGNVVDDFLEKPVVLAEDDIMVNYIETVAENDYVLVENNDKCTVGIITTYDMTLRFNEFLTPYLKFGVIEDCIRRLINSKLDLSGKRPLSEWVFSDYQKLLEKEENWVVLGLDNIDKSVFINKIDEMRRIRNRVAHYKPEPLTIEERFAIDAFADVIEKICGNSSM